MFTEKELIETAKERLLDAEALFGAGRWYGAHYMCGYAVEIALKAKVCTTPLWIHFPSTSKEFKLRSDVKTHDLATLLRFSGEETNIMQTYSTDWYVVVSWDPESRYNPSPGVTESDAKAMIDAAKTLLHHLGVL